MKRGRTTEDAKMSRDPKESAPTKGAESAPPPYRPLRPHRMLFASLLIGFLLWVGVLLLLYFRTVYPERHPSAGTTATRPGASGLPSAPR
jgi:hypothetical protein